MLKCRGMGNDKKRYDVRSGSIPCFVFLKVILMCIYYFYIYIICINSYSNKLTFFVVLFCFAFFFYNTFKLWPYYSVHVGKFDSLKISKIVIVT